MLLIPGGTDGEFFNSSGIYGEHYRRGKYFVYEGGIRVPMIASWPGKIGPGTRSDLISAQYDVIATLGDIAKFKTPEDTDGISFLPTLLGNCQRQETHDFLYWEYPEYGGQVAIRMGDHKVVRQHLKDKEKPTLELYNLKEDPEEKNIAAYHPEIIQNAVKIFENEHRDASVQRFRIPAIESGLLEN